MPVVVNSGEFPSGFVLMDFTNNRDVRSSRPKNGDRNPAVCLNEVS